MKVTPGLYLEIDSAKQCEWSHLLFRQD